MDTVENLFVTLSEELGEMNQAVGKCQRFGLNHKWDSKNVVNRTALYHELLDVFVLWDMLYKEGAVITIQQLLDSPASEKYMKDKQKRVRENIYLSMRLGRLKDPWEM